MKYIVRKTFIYEVDDAYDQEDAIEQVTSYPMRQPNDIDFEAYEVGPGE